MNKLTLTLAVLAVGTVALTALEPQAQATGRGGNQSLLHFCSWYRMKAMSTHDEAWWARWRACIRYHQI